MRLGTIKILCLAFLGFLIASCSSSKLVVNCPDFSTPKEVAVAKKSTKKKAKKKKQVAQVDPNIQWQADLLAMTGEFIFIEDSIEVEQTALVECPVLVLKDKSRILVRVTELMEDSVSVETCDDAAFELKFDKKDLKGIYYDSTKLEQIVWQETFINTDSTYSNEAYYQGEYQLDEASEILLRKARKQALWAIIFGIGSVVLSPLLIPTLLGIPALVLGIKSLKTFRRIPHPSNKKNMSIIGIVLGGLTTLFAALVATIIIVNLIIWGGF